MCACYHYMLVHKPTVGVLAQAAHDRAQKRAAALQQRCSTYKQRADESRRAVRQAQRTIRAFEVLHNGAQLQCPLNIRPLTLIVVE